MRILLTGALVLVAWLGLGAYWHTCQIRCLCDGSNTSQNLVDAAPEDTPEEPPASEPPAALPPGFGVMNDQNEFVFQFSGGLQFSPSESDLSMQGSTTSLPDSLFNYLLAHPNAAIQLTGHVTPEEAESGSLSDLASARATAMKAILTDRGINPDRIMIGIADDASAMESDGHVLTGLDVRLTNMTPEEEEIRDENIARKTLYCEFAAVEFNPDPKLIKYASELKSYLERHPNESVTITGHTDNEGPANTNTWIGKKRARTVRDYFLSQGISGEKMSIATRGEHAPVASNDTEEGRAKNRRIEIVIE